MPFSSRRSLFGLAQGQGRDHGGHGPVERLRAAVPEGEFGHARIAQVDEALRVHPGDVDRQKTLEHLEAEPRHLGVDLQGEAAEGEQFGRLPQEPPTAARGRQRIHPIVAPVGGLEFKGEDLILQAQLGAQPQLGQTDPGHELGPGIEDEPLLVIAPGATTGHGPGLEGGDLDPGLPEGIGGRQPCRACSDNDYPHRNLAFFKNCIAPISLGRIPVLLAAARRIPGLSWNAFPGEINSLDL